jgi:hypothetical protein
VRIGWLKPLYGFTGRTIVCATRVARTRLVEMGQEIAGTDTGVAVYIAVGARGFGDEAYRGRIIGAFFLAPMPAGKSVDDYPFADIDSRLRWPIGWPVEVQQTAKLPLDRAPLLKPLVVGACGADVWRRLTPSFQGGAPSRLDGPLAPLRAALEPAFA